MNDFPAPPRVMSTGNAGRVLVSGAAGFIGSHLCEALLARGYEVCGLIRSDKPGRDDRIRWHTLDLADHKATLWAFRNIRPDMFFHLASRVVGTRDISAVYPTFRNNALTTVNALVALAETGCQRCVFAGSLEEPDLASGETMPSSPYAAAKAASTLYGNMFSDLYQLPVINARIFMVYGPGQSDRKKVIPFSIRSFMKGEAPKFGSLRPVDWIYVTDVVEGLIAAATSCGGVGATVELGSGSFVTVRDVILQIAELMGVEREIVFEDLEERAMEQVRSADVAETQRQIGWAPQVSLAEGLSRTIRYYREIPLPPAAASTQVTGAPVSDA